MPSTASLLSFAALLALLARSPSAQEASLEEDVRFHGGGVTLAGTLILPPGEGPHPALAFTHGANPRKRSDPGYRGFVQSFVDVGVAVFIWDKRGNGESEGVYVEAPDLRVPAADLLGAVAFLREHPQIDRESVGVWGASQGGWVGPMAAAMCEDIAFVVAVSAPGVSPLEQNLYDKGRQLAATGIGEDNVARATAYRRAFWGYLVTGEGFERARELHDGIANEDWFTRANFPFPFVERDALLRNERLLHFARHSGYEPRLTLESVRVPTLVIFGEADPIVPVERSADAFRAAFATSGHEDKLTVRLFPDADHNVRVTRADGSSAPAPGYFDFMTDWVARTAFGFD